MVMLEAIIATPNKNQGTRELEPRFVRDDPNQSPTFIPINRYPQARYEQVGDVYVTLKPAFAKTTAALRSVQFSEGMDILPPAMALTYPVAVGLGRQVTGLIRDETPEVDLGSAL
jgi:hypothetical protein